MENSFSSLLNDIKKEEKPEKRSTTLYLSESNLKWVEKNAKKAGVSKSILLDTLLEVLL